MRLLSHDYKFICFTYETQTFCHYFLFFFFFFFNIFVKYNYIRVIRFLKHSIVNNCVYICSFFPSFPLSFVKWFLLLHVLTIQQSIVQFLLDMVSFLFSFFFFFFFFLVLRPWSATERKSSRLSSNKNYEQSTLFYETFSEKSDGLDRATRRSITGESYGNSRFFLRPYKYKYSNVI